MYMCEVNEDVRESGFFESFMVVSRGIWTELKCLTFVQQLTGFLPTPQLSKALPASIPTLLFLMHITFHLNWPFPSPKPLNTLSWAFFIDAANSMGSLSVQ